MKKIILFTLLLANFYMANAFTRVASYRWRNDDGTETTATWKAATDTPIEIHNLDPIRLRMGAEIDAGQMYASVLNLDAKIQYSENGGTSWVDITATSPVFTLVSSSVVADGSSTTEQINTGTRPFISGLFKSTDSNTAFSSSTSSYTEHEFCIKPTSSIATLTTYTFRIPEINLVKTPSLTFISGSALNFDGVDDYVHINNTIPASDDVTYEAWVYPTKLTGFRAILNHTTWDTGAIHFQFSDDKLHFDLYDVDYACTFPFSTNSWYHIAAVYSKTSGSINFYVNGNLINTEVVSGVDAVSASQPIDMGGWNNSRYFKGTIDEVRIWNRALTQCEIQNNMNGELLPDQTGLVTYYKFNQGIDSGTNATETSLIDSSGNDNTGTLTNFALTGATSNWVSPGGVTSGVISPLFNLLSVATTQTFCAGATVADLVATGTAIKWYDVDTEGTALSDGTVLETATYYVTQTTGSCESPRTAVSVAVGPTTTWTVVSGVGSWSNGVPTSTSKAIIANDYSEAVNLTACGLEVTGTAIVSVPSEFSFTISGVVNVASTASLTFENNANLIQSGTTNANIGNVTVKRATSMMRQDYTYWSSPVAAQNLLNFSPETLATRFYSLNENANTFDVIDPSVNNFSLAKGYAIRAPNTFPATNTSFTGSFTGIPNNGTITIPITNSGLGKGYNLIGNPYPSPINALTFLATNPGTLYFWTHTTQGADVNTNYASFNTLGGTEAFAVVGSNITSSAVPNGIIQTGQAFILQTATPGDATFTNLMRANNTQGQFFKTRAVEKHRIWINLIGEKASNQILLGYMTGATNSVDPSIDGKQIGTGTTISSSIDNENYVIQGRALPFDEKDVIPLSLKADTAGSYTLSLDTVDGIFAGDQAVFLRDNVLKTTQNLKEKAYSFTSEAGVFEKRFEVLYTDSTLGTQNQNLDDNSIVVFKKDNTIIVNTTSIVMKSVQLFDINGRLIAHKNNINASETSFSNLKLAHGVILVQITGTDNKVVTRKLIN